MKRTVFMLEDDFNNSKINRYWMVHRVGPYAYPTSYTHNSRSSAMDEAKRLAKSNPGVVFTILEIIGAVQAQSVVNYPDII